LSKGEQEGRGGLLTEIDKKLLRFLLGPEGQVSSHIISKKLGVPLSTIQRRRKRLETEYLIRPQLLDMQKFGWRVIKLLMATEGGMTQAIGRALLSRKEVVSVVRTIGQHTIDLIAEVIIRDNAELLDLLEDVKAMEGVRDVVWTEVVETIGRKAPPNHVIDWL
jgi:DNA-binding Lrp family transcriptional regulator